VLLSTTLGPFLEESFFRGCLLPLVVRSAGTFLAILATAILIAVFHRPRSLREWLWILTTGVAYGWIRISSGSTAASAPMHMAYNLTLYVCLKI
jgi:membrane protease YdiL (CAAX protease family)